MPQYRGLGCYFLIPLARECIQSTFCSSNLVWYVIAFAGKFGKNKKLILKRYVVVIVFQFFRV